MSRNRQAWWIIGVAAALSAWSSLPFQSETYADGLVRERPLLDAAFRGEAEQVKRLLADGASLADRDREGNTAMHWVVDREAAKHQYGDHVRTLKELLKAGGGVNERNSTGETPLLGAAWNPQLVAALIGAGADVNAHDTAGRTALLHACYCGGEQCEDAEESVRLLLAAGADPNAHEVSGLGPLATAAVYAKPDHVRMLLEAGANPNARTQSGDAVLQWLDRYRGIEREYSILPQWLSKWVPGAALAAEERRVSYAMIQRAAARPPAR